MKIEVQSNDIVAVRTILKYCNEQESTSKH